MCPTTFVPQRASASIAAVSDAIIRTPPVLDGKIVALKRKHQPVRQTDTYLYLGWLEAVGLNEGVIMAGHVFLINVVPQRATYLGANQMA